MEEKEIRLLVETIKHKSGKSFVECVVQQAKEEIISSKQAESMASKSVKSAKQKEQTILDEIVACINAQNARKKYFGICISERTIKESMFAPFCKALETNLHLSTLSFVRCEFSTMECLKYLSDMIKHNRSITSLNLSYTTLLDGGLKVLSEGLKHNTTITELFLDYGSIDDESVSVFSSLILKTTKTLRIIDLSNNNIGNSGFQTILDACKENTRCIDIRLRRNSGISDDQHEEIQKILTKNLSVSGAIDMILDKAIVSINVGIRVKQTTAVLGRPVGRGGPSDAGGLTRGRIRGGTIDLSVAPSHVLSATSECIAMEDFGNSESVRYATGFSHTRGRRGDMQDAMLVQGKFSGKDDEDLFCVFDGHGKQEPANYAAKHISSILQEYLGREGEKGNEVCCLEDAFVTLNEQMKPFAVQCGTTAVVCLIRGDYLFTANVGDSRAVLCRSGKAIRLTVDHKPELEGETERVVAMGGEIKNNRVKGALAVTRALGDWFADDLVSPYPYVTVTKLCKDDNFLLLACDGVFDVFSDDIAIDMIKDIEDPSVAATKLKDESFNVGSTDNISVAVIHFKGVHNEEFGEIHNPKVVRDLWKAEQLILEDDKEESIEPSDKQSESKEPEGEDVPKEVKPNNNELKDNNDEDDQNVDVESESDEESQDIQETVPEVKKDVELTDLEGDKEGESIKDVEKAVQETIPEDVKPNDEQDGDASEDPDDREKGVVESDNIENGEKASATAHDNASSNDGIDEDPLKSPVTSNESYSDGKEIAKEP